MYGALLVSGFYLVIVGIALGFCISWEKRKGKGWFLAFLILFFMGQLFSVAGVMYYNMGIALRPVAAIGWGPIVSVGAICNLLAMIALLGFTIVSRSIGGTETGASDGDREKPLSAIADLIASGRRSPQEIQALLKERLSSRAEVTVREGKQTEILIREGLWRGVSLVLADDGGQCRIARVVYYIPTFMGKVVIFLTSVVVFSTIMMIILSAMLGRFVPALFGVGGVAGYGGYLIVKSILIANIKSSWSVEVNRAAEALGA